MSGAASLLRQRANHLSFAVRDALGDLGDGRLGRDRGVVECDMSSSSDVRHPRDVFGERLGRHVATSLCHPPLDLLERRVEGDVVHVAGGQQEADHVVESLGGRVKPVATDDHRFEAVDRNDWANHQHRHPVSSRSHSSSASSPRRVDHHLHDFGVDRCRSAEVLRHGSLANGEQRRLARTARTGEQDRSRQRRGLRPTALRHGAAATGTPRGRR